MGYYVPLYVYAAFLIYLSLSYHCPFDRSYLSLLTIYASFSQEMNVMLVGLVWFCVSVPGHISVSHLPSRPFACDIVVQIGLGTHGRQSKCVATYVGRLWWKTVPVGAGLEAHLPS